MLKTIPFAAFVIAASVVAGPASAQLARTFVASYGSDTADCSRGAPCRTFQRAHDATSSGGELYSLDTAAYGAITINKSISIENSSTYVASAFAANGAGIIVDAQDTSKVSIRGITLEGAGTGSNGIIVYRVGSLVIADCVVRNVTQEGIKAIPATTAARILVENTTVHNAGIGIQAGSSSTAPNVSIVNSTFFNNSGNSGIAVSGGNANLEKVTSSHNQGFGIIITGTGTAAITDSAFNHNNADGVYVLSGGSGTITNSSSFANATYGITVGSGFLAGTLRTAGNNVVLKNPSGDVAGTLTPVTLR